MAVYEHVLRMSHRAPRTWMFFGFLPSLAARWTSAATPSATRQRGAKPSAFALRILIRSSLTCGLSCLLSNQYFSPSQLWYLSLAAWPVAGIRKSAAIAAARMSLSLDTGRTLVPLEDTGKGRKTQQASRTAALARCPDLGNRTRASRRRRRSPRRQGLHHPPAGLRGLVAPKGQARRSRDP